MWLFDDILKKPASIPMPPADPLAGSSYGWQGSSGSGTWDDRSTPIIVKTEVATVFGAETEAKAIEASMPTEASVHAEEDYSSILVTETAPVVEVAVSVAPTPVAPVALEPVTHPTPVVAPVALTPVAETVVPVTPTPIVAAWVASSSPDALELPQGPSLFDHIMADTPAPVVVAPVVAATPAPVAAPSMFSAFTEVAAPAPVAPVAATSAPEMIVPPLPVPAAHHGNFSTPREFIEKSLASIGLMLANIESRHSAKKSEEDGYRKEKMRFAELEKNAYVEAEIMDRERDHALRMQSMFQSELETDTTNREKKVSHAEKHEDKHSNSKKKQHEEEEALMAS